MAGTASVATAFVAIVPEMQGFEGKLRKAFSGASGVADGVGRQAGASMGGGISSGLKKMIGPIAAVLSTVAVGSFIKDAVSSASDLNEAGTAVAEVFGSATAEINKWASGAANALGQSKLQALNAAKTFGVYGSSAGLAGKANAQFSIGLTKLATDFASFHNASPQEAIDAIGAALRGEAEPIRRFGILINDATLKQQALKMGLIQTTTGALTPQARVLAAQAVIFSQAGAAMGDFERTSLGLANQQRILAAQWENTKSSIGGIFLPFVNAAAIGLNKLLTAIQPVTDAISLFGLHLGNIFTASGGGMAGIQAMLASIGEQFQSWISGGGLTAFLTKLSEQRAAFFNAIITALPGITDALMTALPDMLNWVVSYLIPQMVSQFQDLVMKLVALASTLIPQMANVLTTTLPALATSLAGMLPSLISNLLAMIPSILAAANTVFKSLIDALITVVPQLLTTITQMLPSLVRSITDMLPSIINSAITLFMGLIDGLVTAIPQLLIAIVNALPGILEAIVSLLPSIINGAIQLFMGLLTGLINAIPRLLQGILDALPQILSTLISMLPTLMKGATDLFLGLVTGLLKALPDLLVAIIKMGPQITLQLLKMIPDLIVAGFQLLKGLIQGVWENAPRLLGELAKSLGDLLINGVKSIFGIHSPSKVFHGFGVNITKGLVNGLSEGSKELQDTSTKMYDWVAKNFDAGKITATAKKKANAAIKAYTAALKPLAAEHEKILEQIDTAEKNLADKIKARGDYISSMTDKYGSSLDISAKTTATDAIKQLEDQIAKNKELARVLGELKKLGLSNDLYGQIMQSGNIDFAKSILSGGDVVVQQLNSLANEANATAGDLATSAGDVLFNKGINVAQGIVDGLKAKESELNKQMESMANAFISTVTTIISGGQTKKGLKLGLTPMASGGFVTKPTPALIGEAGPEVVTPLKDFQQMMGMGTGTHQTVVYNAAPNNSLDSEQALMTALKRAKVVAAW